MENAVRVLIIIVLALSVAAVEAAEAAAREINLSSENNHGF